MRVDKDLTLQLDRIHRRVMLEVEDNANITLTPTQDKVLRFLMTHPEMEIYQKHIEQEFGLQKSSVTSLLQLMEKRGLIQRVRVSMDGRLKRIILTKASKSLRDDTKSFMRRMDKKMLQGITASDQEVFFRVLEQVQENLSKDWQ